MEFFLMVLPQPRVVKPVWKSSQPRNREPWNSVYSIRDSSNTKFVQIIILGWSLTFLHKGSLRIYIRKYWNLKLDVSYMYMAQMLHQPKLWKYIIVKVSGWPLTFVSMSHDWTFSEDFEDQISPKPFMDKVNFSWFKGLVEISFFRSWF